MKPNKPTTLNARNQGHYVKYLFVFAAIGLLDSLSLLFAQLPAFPGAEGAGAYAVGGRYGDVYHVTTLSSDAATPGSFYYGIANAPAAGRTIVFDVSGYIHIPVEYTMSKPKITIAGQTAPGDGIGFRDGTFKISATDTLIRHIRFREARSADAVDLNGAVSRCIMDHCDVMFGKDENLSSFSSPPDNFTFQWCMNSWGLESHSCGGLWDQNHATCHHSLWSHNHTRNPKARPVLLDWVNNVTFDWDIGFIMGDSDTPAAWQANVRGCYFVSPPGNTHSVALEKANLDRNGVPNFSLYLDDCAMDGNGDGILNVSKTGYALASGSYNTSAAPFLNNGLAVTRDDYLTAYKKVLSAAGPLRLETGSATPLRDELNTILVRNVVNQVRHHISSPSGTGASNGGWGYLNSSPTPVDSDRDGLPDFWETALGSNVSQDDHTNAVPAGAFVPAGYTLLEEYLQFLALPHGSVAKFTPSVPSSLDVDLHKYTLGFTNKWPVTYTISNVTNGTVTLIGGYLAHFVPPTNFYGRARFDFNVTDGDGSTWTQTFAVLVSAAALPRDLKWQGDGTANVWDTSTANFLFGTTPTAFSIGDYVTIDDSGSNTPMINLTTTHQPSSLTVNATKDFTLGGTGSLAGAMALNKSGGGTLTVYNANSFTGNVDLQGGTVSVGNNASIGSGNITLNGATLSHALSASGTYLTVPNNLSISAGTTNTIIMSQRETISGTVNNSGTLNLVAPSVLGGTRDYLSGSWSQFAGGLNLSGGAMLHCQVQGGSFDGFNHATVTISNETLGVYGTPGGETINIGALSGNSGAGLAGSGGGYGGLVTWQVGGLNMDSTFAGAIQNGSLSPAALTKTGSGTLTLSGNSSHTGATTVNLGTLVMNGTFSASPVTVASGANLAGNGSLLGGVTVQGGGNLAPDGTLTTSNNLTLNSSAVMNFDLTASPGGANDKITMQGGLLTMGNPQMYHLNLTDNALGAGTYDLIDGGDNTSATGVGFASNLPGNTRQSFAFQRPSSGNGQCYVRLVVTGNAASLVWRGTSGSTWDLSTTANWLNGAAPDVFYHLDTVRFDDTSTNGNVTISGAVEPANVLVTNSIRPYTLGGGALAGFAKLTKAGSGTLILNSSNSFTGGTWVNGGTLQLVTSSYAGGGGPITLNGGTLYLNGVGTSTTVSSIGTNTLQTSGQPYAGFALQGTGWLNLNVGGGGVFSPDGDWSGFGGTLNFTTGNWVRELNTSNFGSSNAIWNLNSGGLYNKYGGATIYLGALFGGTSAALSGATTSYATTTTYVIGGVNTNSVFHGTISDGGAANTALVFNGPGSLALTGNNSYTGNTAVNAGTLIINNTSGSGTGAGDVLVASGATLAGTGSISGLASIADGATLAPGNSAGTLTIGDGLVLGGGSIMNFELGTVSDRVSVTGDLTLAGTLNVTGLAGFGVGAYALFTYGGTLSLGTVTLGTKPAGYDYSINTNTSGAINLIVAPTTPPCFGQLLLNGTELVFSGTNGIPLGNYHLLSATNLSTPLADWTPVAANQFDAMGNFRFTNSMNPGSPQMFYRLQLE